MTVYPVFKYSIIFAYNAMVGTNPNPGYKQGRITPYPVLEEGESVAANIALSMSLRGLSRWSWCTF